MVVAFSLPHLSTYLGMWSPEVIPLINDSQKNQ